MLPAPTTARPDSSTALIALRWRRKPAWNAAGVSAGSKGSGPRPPSSPAAGSASIASDQTTAPKRRGSVRRNVPRLVTKSKWSCAPGAPGSAASDSEPDIPRCTSSPPLRARGVPASGSQRYLPRRRGLPTTRPRIASGACPSGRRSGLPTRTASTRAPSRRSASDTRVTSTSGSSGMEGIIEAGANLKFVLAPGVSMTGIATRVRSACTGLALAFAIAFATAAPTPAQAPVPPANSSLDAPLFYQLLIGELELVGGHAGNAYEVILDAARRHGDDELYQRATDIALHAHAGDQALAAARAWRSADRKSVVSG